MLVEKLICNARLNLLILHPLPTPSQLPRQTEEPNGLSVPRCQEIKISICEWGAQRGGRQRGSRSVGLTHQRWVAWATMFSLAFPWQEPPSLFAKLYLLALYVHLSAGKQNMSSRVPTSLTRHTHPSTGGKDPQTELN